MDPTGKYVIQNGTIIPRRELANESIHWLAGDKLAFSCRWRASGSRILYYVDQYEELDQKLSTLGFSLTNYLGADRMKGLLVQLIQKERFFKGISITFILITNLKTGQQPMLLIFVDPYPQDMYILNSVGLQLGILDHLHYPGPVVTEGLSRNHPIRKHWLHEGRQAGFDCICLTTSTGALAETPDALLYLVRNQKVYTPDPEMGVSSHAIQKNLMIVLAELDFELIQSPKLKPGHLLQADEVFCANDFDGIRWIMGYEDKRYYKKTSLALVNALNSTWTTVD